MTKVEVRICGLGGQGVVLAGQILGRAAVYDGKNVVQTQSYGAEARGSAAKSEVIISEEKIGYPMVRKCDVLVAMTQSTLDSNIKDLKEDAVLLVDEDLVKQVPETKAKVYKLPITRVAQGRAEVGDVRECHHARHPDKDNQNREKRSNRKSHHSQRQTRHCKNKLGRLQKGSRPVGSQKPSLKHDKSLIYEQRVCGKQDRQMLGFYEDSREETQKKRKILEENAQPAQEESAP